MYIVYDKDAVVTAIYHNPVPEQLKALDTQGAKGVDMDGEIPQPKYVQGLVSKLKLDVKTKKLYYDYVSPDTLDSKVYQLQKDNEQLKHDNAALTLKLTEKGVL